MMTMKKTKIILAVVGLALALTGCWTAEETKDRVTEVMDKVAAGCSFAIKHEVVVAMVASADASGATLAASVIANTVCRAYLASRTGTETAQTFLKAPCPYGEAYGVCIDGAPK
jgi:hypothetical protein